MSETAAWITLNSIVSAAHYVKNNGADVSGQMAILMPDDDVAQAIFVQVIILVTKNVRCSEMQMMLASKADEIVKELNSLILETTFDPKISVGDPNMAARYIPEGAPDRMRILIIEDKAYVIELFFHAVQMVGSLLYVIWGETKKLYDMVGLVARGSEHKPSIFHQHYADSAFAATLDALFYYVLGFAVGVKWEDGDGNVDIGYRCVNILGSPPLDPKMIEVALASYQNMMMEIKKP